MKFIYKEIEYELILFVLSGSRFYNTHYEKGEHPFIKDYESDCDYKGVYIASMEDKISLSKNYKKEIQPAKLDKKSRKEILNQINEELNINIKLDEDFVLYEIETFIKMAQNDNPNILDIFFTDKDSITYINKYGEMLLKENKNFLSKRLEESFSKYGLSQMTKMKNHYKMIGKYPQITEVTEAVKKAYENKKINFQWISDNFSGDLATYITGISQEEYNKIKNKKYNYEWEDFKKEFCQNIKNIQKYHRALMIDYINAKHVNGKNIPLDTKQESILTVGTIKNNKGIEIKEPTVKDFLMYKCAFRTIGESVYNIFTPPENYEKFKGGIISKTGLEIKKQDPKEIGYFLFTIVVKKNEFKAHQDEIKKLWEWKTNRNEKRSVLEEHFVYDTKNAAHLIYFYFLLLLVLKILTYFFNSSISFPI